IVADHAIQPPRPVAAGEWDLGAGAEVVKPSGCYQCPKFGTGVSKVGGWRHRGRVQRILWCGHAHFLLLCLSSAAMLGGSLPPDCRETDGDARPPFSFLCSPPTELIIFHPVSPKKRIAIIPGDGIGPEVIAEAVKVVQASRAGVEMTHFDWSANRYLADGVTVPPDGFATLERDFDAILLGAFGDPRVPSNIHAKEILLGMRFRMDLYANVRPVRLLDASLCPLKGVEPKDVDFTIIRENTEGLYVDVGGVFKQGTPDEIAVQEDVNTRKGVERVIRYAFEYARRRARPGRPPKLLMTDKANVMTYAHGLWQRVFKE